MLLARAVAAALLLAVVAGCNATRTTTVIGSPFEAASVTVRPAVARPPKDVTDEAIAVLAARLDALGIGTYSIAAGDAITVSIGNADDAFRVERALGATGVVDFSPQPGDEAVPAIGEKVSGQESLWSGDHVESAAVATDGQGNPAIDIELDEVGAAALAEWSAAHVMDYLMVVVDGVVVATPVVRGPIDGGELEISFGGGPEPAIPIEALAAILASGPLPEAWAQP